MRRLAAYPRILRLPGRDGWLIWALAAGDLLVACVQFLDPALFGRVIGLLTRSADLAPEALTMLIAGIDLKDGCLKAWYER